MTSGGYPTFSFRKRLYWEGSKVTFPEHPFKLVQPLSPL